MKRFFVAIACAALGLFLSFGYSAVAQMRPATPASPATQAPTTQTSPSTQTPATQTPATQTSPDIQASPATPATSAAVNNVDRQFVVAAGESGLANIAMGQLALQRSNNPQVRQFAQAEIAEQQQVSQSLKQIAPRIGATLPTAPGPKYQALLNRLAQLQGEQFNQAYLSEGGVNAHLEVAATFQREAQFGQNPNLVALANKGLPTIQQHFNIATKLTNYRFAQVDRRFNNISATPGTPQSNNAPAVAPGNSSPR